MSSLYTEDHVKTRAVLSDTGAIVDEVSAETGTFDTITTTTFTSTTITAGTLTATSLGATTATLSGALVSPTVVFGTLAAGSLVSTATNFATLSGGTLQAQNLTCTGTLTVSTITGSFAATTKGDIVTHDGTSIARLGVGTDGQYLSADSAQTTGLRWITATSAIPATPTTLGTIYAQETSRNVAIGYGALSSVTGGGTRNVAIGYNAGSTITTGTDNVMIGNNAQPSSATAIGQIVIGTNATGAGDNMLTLGTSILRFNVPGMTTSSNGDLMTRVSGVYSRIASWTGKGSLLTADSTLWVVVPVGTDGYVLTATSAAHRLAWTAPQYARAVVYRYGLQTSSQSIPNNITTNVAPSPITGGASWNIGFSGTYVVICQVTWENNASGTRYLQYFDAGLYVYEHEMQPINGTNYTTHTIMLILRDISSPQMNVRQTSGGALNVHGNADGSTHMSVYYLGG